MLMWNKPGYSAIDQVAWCERRQRRITLARTSLDVEREQLEAAKPPPPLMTMGERVYAEKLATGQVGDTDPPESVPDHLLTLEQLKRRRIARALAAPHRVVAVATCNVQLKHRAAVMSGKGWTELKRRRERLRNLGNSNGVIRAKQQYLPKKKTAEGVKPRP